MPACEKAIRRGAGGRREAAAWHPAGEHRARGGRGGPDPRCSSGSIAAAWSTATGCTGPERRIARPNSTRMRTASPFSAAEALYNLGTVLLRPSENSEAEEYLRLATEDRGPGGHATRTLQPRNSFSPSAGGIVGTGPLGSPPRAAIRSNREALRLDPQDEDARWNLAFSQLVLDELTGGDAPAESSDPVEEESRAGADEGLVVSGARPG